MKRLNAALAAIPGLLASKPSIIFYLLLFVYLVGFGVLGLFVPALEPSATLQLVLGNYTNVVSALGASIAAGGTVHVIREQAKHNDRQHQFREQVRAHLNLPHPDPPPSPHQ